MTKRDPVGAMQRALLLLAVLVPAMPLGAAEPVCAYEGPHGSACVVADDEGLGIMVATAAGVAGGAEVENRDEPGASVLAARSHIDAFGVANASASFQQRHEVESPGDESLLTELIVDARVSTRIASLRAQAGVVEDSVTQNGTRACVRDEAYAVTEGLIGTPRLSLPLGCPDVPVFREIVGTLA